MSRPAARDHMKAKSLNPDRARAIRTARARAEILAMAQIVKGFEALEPQSVPTALAYVQKHFGLYASSKETKTR